jgi:hypothetical protein
MSKFIPVCLLFFLVSCARTDFYQKTALTETSDQQKIAAGTIPDSVTVTVGRHYDKNFLQTFFFGKHYRKLWATPVKLPVYKSKAEFGGLTPVSLGGGFQTTSLTLKDKNGSLYVLRSLDKDPQKTLPKSLRNTFLVNILRDQTSAANPFAPVVLPPLSQVAGIFYSTPKLVYVTETDSSSGKFSPRLAGKVMLLEEKFDGKETLTPAFGNAIDLKDSEDVLKKRFENNHHQIDQHLFARSRLFDVLIGDWDRHEGQWQWAVYKNGTDFLYKPIPKDRDQAFYRFNDGVITWLASKTPVLKKFQTFHHHYGNISGWLFNARFIDARALNEITREEWLQHAEEMKAALTDEIINQAFRNLPKPIYDQVGPETITKLKKRRNTLPEAAAEIYKILAKEVMVAGTDQEEKFVVTRLASGETLVEVFRTGKDEQKPFYSRTFKPKETRKIILHGLGSEDKFEIAGKAKKAIPLAVYGGEGEDELEDKSEIKSSGKSITVYDTTRGIIMEKTRETRKKLSRNVAVNAYDREGL